MRRDLLVCACPRTCVCVRPITESVPVRHRYDSRRRRRLFLPAHRFRYSPPPPPTRGPPCHATRGGGNEYAAAAAAVTFFALRAGHTVAGVKSGKQDRFGLYVGMTIKQSNLGPVRLAIRNVKIWEWNLGVFISYVRMPLYRTTPV